MAYKIIRPRHGIKSLWNTYKSRIYKLGEMLVESPESGVGSGPVNIKFGDGVTDYEKLPYAVLAPVDEVSEGINNPPTSDAVHQAVQQCFQSVSDGKELIASAITDMEVPTDATATFAKMAENILAIESGVDTSDATATAADIIKSKTAYVNGEKLTGTYDFAAQTAANAVAAQLTTGYTAWVNGTKITGTRPVIVTSQSGSVTLPEKVGNKSVTQTVTVTFPKAFDNVPTVNLTANYPSNTSTLSASSVTRTGFTLKHVSSYSSDWLTIVITWRAQA